MDILGLGNLSKTGTQQQKQAGKSADSGTQGDPGPAARGLDACAERRFGTQGLL